MATTTEHYHLKKPSPSDAVDIGDINTNMDMIDEKLFELNNIVNLIYPVGAIYISTNSTNPSNLFGGTWQRIGAGRTLIDCGTGYTAGSTGGSATVTLTAAQSGVPSHTHTYNKPNANTNSHALTVAQIPAHNHGLHPKNGKVGIDTNVDPGLGAGGYIGNGSFRTYYINNTTNNTGGGQGHSHGIGTTSAASGAASANASQAHNNMPPYLAVYMWKRTA